MTKRELLETIYLLREKAELNKLVVFVGAGVSRNVPGMLSWSELVTEMAKAIGYSKCASCSHRKKCKENCKNCAEKDRCAQKCLLSNDYSPDDYLKIPQYVFNKKPKTYKEVLNKSISDKSIPNAPLSDIIFNLNPAHIITTNYDKLLESSSNEYRRQYEVVITDKDLLETTKSKYIIKMHGDILMPDTIVLKEQDYLEYSQKHVLIELFIKALLADHTILFLGYSLNDYNVKLIISWINFLRSQNKAITKHKKIGYIVLDEKGLAKETIAYFRNNNIGVLNIHTLSLIDDVPPLLTFDKGKRLYSFLNIINNPTLEGGVFAEVATEKAIDFANKHKICDYSLLLRLLNINHYLKTDSRLVIYDDNQYKRLISFLNSGSKKAELNQLLVNCDIRTIYSSSNGDSCYSTDTSFSNQLFSDPFFTLYLDNRYADLLDLCNAEKSDVIKSAFYRQFATGFLGIEEQYSKIVFDELSEDDKVSFLNNQAFIEALKSRRFDSGRVTQYINNIANSRTREVFQPYLDLFEGNSSKRIIMRDSVSKLKEDIGKISTSFFSNGAISSIYKIKNPAYTQYYYHFINHILFLGYKDLPTFLSSYIEAIIYANSDAVEAKGDFFGFETRNEKYSISQIDFDIISKFISIKDLHSIMSSVTITTLHTSFENVRHLVSCFNNLVNSLVKMQTFGYYHSSIITLINLMQLLSKVNLSKQEKSELSNSIHILFSNEVFNKRFWNTSCPDHRICTKIVATLFKRLSSSTNIQCINSIISSPEFFDYSVNTDFSAARSILGFFLNKDDLDEYKTDIYKIIDQEQDFRKQVLLIRFFYRMLPDDEKTQNYKVFLSNHFSELNIQDIYDLVFSNWITISSEASLALVNDIITLYKKQSDAVHVFPDPLDSKLHCLYLLHITGKIEDISALDELSSDYPHLHFLLHPDTFDYKQVDFSNYMWANFAHRSKYAVKFVEHKEDIIPKLKDRLEKDEASEEEKKILYGIFLHGEEIWKY